MTIIQMDDFGLVEELHHRLRARTNMQLVVNVLQMGADGVDADGEPLGNFLGGIALGQVLEDFSSRCERFSTLALRGSLRKD